MNYPFFTNDNGAILVSLPNEATTGKIFTGIRLHVGAYCSTCTIIVVRVDNRASYRVV